MQFGLSLFDDEERKRLVVPRTIWGLIALVWLLKYDYHEIVQFIGADTWREHFSSVWNFNDIIWLTLGPIIVAASIPTKCLINQDILIVMSAFVCFSMMVKALDWMRLFDKTAFYILLILETLKDIAGFLLLFFMSLMMFGIPMTMLDLNRIGESHLIADTFDIWLLDTLLSQYLIALGIFDVTA